MFELNAGDYDKVIAWAADESGTVPVPSDALKGWFSLNQRIQTKLASTAAKCESRATRLQSRLDGKKEKQQAAFAAGEFKESGLDSAMLAAALVYELRLLGVERFYDADIMALMYIIYADWLVASGERACIEHPKTFGTDKKPIGAWFWAAKNRYRAGWIPDAKAKSTLLEARPGLAKLMENVARKYLPYITGGQMKDVTKLIIKSAPFQEVIPKHPGDRWSRDIPDGTIWAWKKEINSNKEPF